MTRVLSIFKLVYMDTTHITPNNINNTTGFNILTNNYLKYWNININV